MTIIGWIIFIIVSFIIIIGATILAIDFDNSKISYTTTHILVALLLIAICFAGIKWFYTNTAAGQRALIDQKSNLKGGIERTITVFTANGEVIAQYQGKIDIAANDGGYIKFDFNGKRYIYYNCFVETIADIEEKE